MEWLSDPQAWIALATLAALAPGNVFGPVALLLMGMGFLILRSCGTPAVTPGRAIAPATPLVYIAALFFVFTLARG